MCNCVKKVNAPTLMAMPAPPRFQVNPVARERTVFEYVGATGFT